MTVPFDFDWYACFLAARKTHIFYWELNFCLRVITICPIWSMASGSVWRLSFSSVPTDIKFPLSTYVRNLGTKIWIFVLIRLICILSDKTLCTDTYDIFPYTWRRGLSSRIVDRLFEQIIFTTFCMLSSDCKVDGHFDSCWSTSELFLLLHFPGHYL